MNDPKKALDENTPYVTLLPPMDEGFHIGYQANPGICCDGSQKPREWLENMAKYLHAQGEDVGYSIPDVLASEQQLRRLSRLPRETAMKHQEMLDYRGVLVLLLLWDTLAKRPKETVLGIERVGTAETGFTRAVIAALPPSRTKDGLTIVTLAAPEGEKPDAVPLCLLSRAMVLSPAANMSDLSGLLPPSVKWYHDKRFHDPCAYLSEEQRTILLLRLRFLQAMNENPSLHSPLYSPDAQLRALLQQLIDDVLAQREEWRNRLLQGDRAAEQELRTRILLVYGAALRKEPMALTERIARMDSKAMAENFLLKHFLPSDFGDSNQWNAGAIGGENGAGALFAGPSVRPPSAGPSAGPSVRPPSAGSPSAGSPSAGSPSAGPSAGSPVGPGAIFWLRNTAIARRSDAFLLEPTGAEGEGEVVAHEAREIALLDRYDEEWRKGIAGILNQLLKDTENRTRIHPLMRTLLARWKTEYDATPTRGEKALELHFPDDTASPTLLPLVMELLGEEAAACARKPFSDCLTLIEGGDASLLGGSLDKSDCVVEGTSGNHVIRYLPPLSLEMVGWLQKQGERGDPCAPTLNGMRCRLSTDGQRLEARFSLICRLNTEDGSIPGSVLFVREYALRQSPEDGGAFVLPAAALPSVTVWPNVRLSAQRWRQYYVHAHHPDAFDVLALTDSGWVQGELHSAEGEIARRQERRRSWRTACVSRFPAFVGLRRGKLCLGALINDQPMRLLRHEEPAVIGLDFGSISTTVMLRQGEKVQAASLPEGLHNTLLCPDSSSDEALGEELIPKTALTAEQRFFYSVLDLFTDDPEQWRQPLLDGHIYYPTGESALTRKNEGTLYYDLKWSEEEYVLRSLRLFLKQVMLQASLAARLAGSDSVSWRISMPGAMPLHRRQAYLDMMRGLCREVGEECGLPLNKNCPPVLYAAEDQADGLYFRFRNEVNARGGYLNLDLGGSTADISLWLNGAAHATAECSLLLGCRKILFASVINGHIDAFEKDFASGSTPVALAAQELVRALRQSDCSLRVQQKAMLMMDDFFATFATETKEIMSKRRAQGQLSYVEALLTFNIGYLFYLCGVLLNRVWQEEELRALLPKRMELCIAGNGGQFLKIFDREQLNALCQIALSALPPEHPVKTLAPVQSANPKEEVALGLLYDEGELQSAIQATQRWNGTMPDEGEQPAEPNPLTAYLYGFCRAFPQAAEMLLGSVCDTDPTNGAPRLSPTAQLELRTIAENENGKTPEDDFATYTRCFAGLKRLWKI
ncbi:MAG: hypothetical protein PHI98_00475 [Eubacteriales bacterium]|nr:hypothetical protein [Eubacteriales bacterium]